MTGVVTLNITICPLKFIEHMKLTQTLIITKEYIIFIVIISNVLLSFFQSNLIIFLLLIGGYTDKGKLIQKVDFLFIKFIF